MLLLSPSEEVCSPRGSPSPRSTPKSPGSPYFAYNPDTFDQMKYRDLQSLAKKLNLGGRGTREALIEKLSAWHTKTIIHQDRSAPIQNFSMVPVPVKGASPRLLSPLTKKAARNVDGTPRGILSPLKRARSWVNMQPIAQTTSEGISLSVPSGPSVVVEEEVEEQEASAKRPRKNISFSVYNGVRLISPRRREPSPMQHFIQSESDPDSLDFTGSSPFEDDAPPKLSSPEGQLYKPSVPEHSRSPLQAVQRFVTLPLRLPSFLSSFLSPSAPSSASALSSSSSSLSIPSSTFSSSSSSSSADAFPSSTPSHFSSYSSSSDSSDSSSALQSLTEQAVLPYPTCQTATIHTNAVPSIPSVASAYPSSEVSQAHFATASAATPSHTATATTTITIAPPSLSSSTSNSSSNSATDPSLPSALLLPPSTPVSVSAVDTNTDSSKPIVLQETWSAKERRTRRSSFGEGAADKANRLARSSAQKPSRLSLPAVERPKRRRSLA